MEPTSPQRQRKPKTSRAVRRLWTHLALGATSILLAIAISRSVPSNDALARASLATAYVALGLFVATLAFGPLAALRGRRYPLSTDVRRDVGIWAGIAALAHVVLGLQVHLRG